MKQVKLQVQGLQVSLSGRRILQDVGLSVSRGRFCAVVGPNGSGKTTLIRSLYRSLSPDAGSVRIDDQDLKDLPRAELARRVAVLRQEPDLSFDFSALELVLMGRSPFKGLLEPDREADLEAAKDCLRACDAESFAERGFLTLSGGEKQRVLGARSLAQQPGLLLLDEPTNHLDLYHQLDILHRVRNLGCTVVAALHDLQLAHTFADQVVVLSAGRVLADGPPDEALTPQRIREVFNVRARRVEEGAQTIWAFERAEPS